MSRRRPAGDGMVRKREDGRWEGRIVVGHKQNGAPIFRYVLAKTQKELLAKLHRDMEVYQDAQLTEDSRMTLGEYLDRWMAEYGSLTLRPNTLRSYEQYIRCYIKPYLGGKIVSRVTRPDIQRLYTRLKREGRVHDHPEFGHELSDTMVRRIHAMLHRCLKDAERDHIIPCNPTDGASVPKACSKPKQILDRAQMDAFLKAVDASEVWRDFFYTELTTGLRRGEICGLMWQDFDESAGTLKILRSVNAPKRGELEIGDQDQPGPADHPAAAQYRPTAERAEEARGQPVDLPGAAGPGEAGASQRRLLLDEGAAEGGGLPPHPVPRPASHLRHPRPRQRRGRQDALRHPGSHQRVLHPGHLHSRDAGYAESRQRCGGRLPGKSAGEELRPWQENAKTEPAP